MASSFEIKKARCAEANKVIEAISIHGRRFFYNRENNRIARMEVDKQGRIWLIDDYSQKRIYTQYRYEWRNFSHGGTMRRLIEALRDYIRTGIPIHPAHFGPWPPEFCGGDLWGYGATEMEIVRKKVLATEAVRKRVEDVAS